MADERKILLKELELKVDHGAVVVSSIQKVLDDPNAKAWEVDLHTKYAVVVMQSMTDSKVGVHLGWNEGTLGLDESKPDKFTDFWLDFGSTEMRHNWQVLAACARYTLRIVAYRVSYELHEVVQASTRKGF